MGDPRVPMESECRSPPPAEEAVFARHLEGLGQQPEHAVPKVSVPRVVGLLPSRLFDSLLWRPRNCQTVKPAPVTLLPGGHLPVMLEIVPKGLVV